jgi:hypothetical protein
LAACYRGGVQIRPRQGDAGNRTKDKDNPRTWKKLITVSDGARTKIRGLAKGYHLNLYLWAQLLVLILHDRDINDLNIFLRLLLKNSRILDFVDYIQALDRSAKNGMLIVKPGLE